MKCTEKTKSGAACKNNVAEGSEYCHIHLKAHRKKDPKAKTDIGKSRDASADSPNEHVTAPAVARSKETDAVNDDNSTVLSDAPNTINPETESCIVTKGQSVMTSLKMAITECDRRSDKHDIISIVFGVLAILTLIVMIVLASHLVASEALQKVTTKKPGGQIVTKEPVISALLIVLPMLAIISGFFISLSRFHLRALSRWDDYGIAFARIRIAANSQSPEEKASLLAAPFATIGALPELEISAVVDNLERLGAITPKGGRKKRKG